MFKLVIALLCSATLGASQAFLANADEAYRFAPLQPDQPPLFDFDYRVGPYRLCTYNTADFQKCLYTLRVAENYSIPLALECVQKGGRDNCLNSVEEGSTDMVVLTGHGYQAARNRGLRPVLYARDDESSLYIAVAPKNITLVDMQEAPIILNTSDHSAYHAGILFNLQRGHDICGFTKASLGPYIRIVNSAHYKSNDDEVLICPTRLTADFADYRQCNFDADLQRAVFVRSALRLQQVVNIRRLFSIILSKLGPNEDGKTFNFFATFMGRDNVIFKNNTIAFDSQPTYRNGVNEKVFSFLHCNQDNHPHDQFNLL